MDVTELFRGPFNWKGARGGWTSFRNTLFQKLEAFWEWDTVSQCTQEIWNINSRVFLSQVFFWISRVSAFHTGKDLYKSDLFCIVPVKCLPEHPPRQQGTLFSMYIQMHNCLFVWMCTVGIRISLMHLGTPSPTTVLSIRGYVYVCYLQSTSFRMFRFLEEVPWKQKKVLGWWNVVSSIQI